MRLIKKIKQLEQNINNIEKCLSDGTKEDRKGAFDLIKCGTCFVAYSVGDEFRFAPSRFLGYVNNQVQKHMLLPGRDGKETNKAIIKILKTMPIQDKELEKSYIKYCKKLRIIPNKKGAFGVTRKFWKLEFDNDFNYNIEISEGFPEGKVVERIHKTRERNRQVIKTAKDNFKKKHGSLFCQICKFDFEKVYKKIGKDFIEGHHTIAVCDMAPEDKTKPEDIAMLCSNCHRMIHKKRPWLTMKELTKLI